MTTNPKLRTLLSIPCLTAFVLSLSTAGPECRGQQPGNGANGPVLKVINDLGGNPKQVTFFIRSEHDPRPTAWTQRDITRKNDPASITLVDPDRFYVVIWIDSDRQREEWRTPPLPLRKALELGPDRMLRISTLAPIAECPQPPPPNVDIRFDDPIVGEPKLEIRLERTMPIR
jgi:hypothetical protein